MSPGGLRKWKLGHMRGLTLTRAAWKAGAVATAAALLTCACGSSGASSGPAGGSSAAASASPSALRPASALCQDADALRASLDKLKHVTIGKGTGDEITADLADVKTKLDALTSEAHRQWQPQISALKESLAKLQTAVKNLTSGFSASNASATVTALHEVGAAGSDLLAKISQQCPSASPSPGS